MIPRVVLPLALLSLLPACASNMSGLDGVDKHSCPYSEGVRCQPMSQVYEESVQGGAGPAPGTPEASSEPSATASPALPSRPRLQVPTDPGEAAGLPLRSRPSVMRVWVAPWEDADGDLHEASWMVLRLDDGRWNIEHVRARIQEGFGATLAPPPGQEAPPSQAAAPARGAALAKDVADILPQGLVPGGKAPKAPFFDTPQP